MAAQTSALKRVSAGPYPHARCISLGVAAATTIRQGMLVAKNRSGFAEPLSATNPDVIVMGVYEGGSDAINAGSNGDIDIDVTRGPWRFPMGSGANAITVADIGYGAYALDNQTLSRDSNQGQRPLVGRVIGIEGGEVIVEVGEGIETPFDLPVLAGADLSSSQFLFVKLNNAGKAVLCGAGEDALGILQNAPTANNVAVIRTYGISKCIGGGSIALPARIAPDSAGKAKSAVLGFTKTDDAGAAVDPLLGSNVAADALTACTGADATFLVFVRGRGSVPTTAS